ncbi:hypothetical protein BsIDN1_54380 [Bacillus safensis]|uniref:Autolysin n=1 Tax=Bacillus safensis TaxID=561879 RepID=A0A5S9ME87_BACIA|nr:hypothetical protein BsIDN1_54380 [Bacillus safensis]
MKSIGIEICENADGSFEQAVENAQWLIRKLVEDFGIPLSNVVPHKHWAGKSVQGNFSDDGISLKLE